MRTAVGLARLRVDGYVSLDASFDGGTITTVPVIPGASRLHLNAVARFGEIVVEVLDAQGNTVDGGTSIPIRQSGTEIEVAWPNDANSPLETNLPIQLRFHLRNARLYSYWVN